MKQGAHTYKFYMCRPCLKQYEGGSLLINQRNVYGDSRLFFGPGPFIGGLLGGFLGSALFGPPRPFYPPYAVYPPFYGSYYGGGPFYYR